MVADHDILVRMKSEAPGLPDMQVIEAVRKQIDIDRNCVVRNAKPMTYVVHSGEPVISLVTDIGLEMTLRDLIWGSANRTFSKEFKAAEGEVSSLSGDNSGSKVAGNIYAMGLIAILQMNLQLALQQRFAASGTTTIPLKDLKVVFLSHDQPGFTLPKDRPAYYDSGESVLYARLEHPPSLHNGDSIEQVALATTQTLPATMLHEFYHYLYYRPSVSNSGFALEGEATAYGEMSEQQIVAGATLGPKDKLRLLARQSLTSPSTSAAATAEFNRLARSRLNGIPYTPVQCSLMRQAINDHIAPLRPLALQARLTLTPKMFQSQPDLAAEYSEAWAVYHVDSVEHRGWSKWIESMVTKLNDHQELGETDLQQLKVVNDETLAWLSKESAVGAPQCLALPDGTNSILHERRE